MKKFTIVKTHSARYLLTPKIFYKYPGKIGITLNKINNIALAANSSNYVLHLLLLLLLFISFWLL